MDTNGKLVFSIPRKKRNVDRISRLPDSLVHYILSFLPTQQVVQTCVLSKRWKTIWTHMPTINFDYKDYVYVFKKSRRFLPSIGTSYKRLVIGVLSQHCGTNLQKLSYSSSEVRNDIDRYLLEFLISYAGCHMVRELCIDAPDMDMGDIDWEFCLSKCKSLTMMKMSCWVGGEWGSLKLPSLRTLEIDCGWETHSMGIDEFQGNIVSGLPNLESLVLDNYLCNTYSICAPKLEYLEVGASHVDLHLLELELLAPNLKCVKFKNVLAAVESNSDFPCLDKVNFVIEDCDVDLFEERELSMCVHKFLQAFHNAESLTLPMVVLKFLLPYPSITECLKFRNLRHLKLKTELDGTNKKIGLPVSLFPCFPSLKTLVLDLA